MKAGTRALAASDTHAASSIHESAGFQIQRIQRLSKAERGIVDEVRRGRRNSEIARALGKSLGTVKNQLSSAFRKLGVESRSQLLILLLRE
jgi:DNA-binding CsgD family transcriptional regulator